MKKWMFLLLFLVACTKKETSSGPAQALTPEQLVEKGKSVYISNCIACHNADPKLDGTLGPAVAGSSKDLLEARVLRGNYPEGYKPKRATHTMVALPHLANQMDALYSYLNQ